MAVRFLAAVLLLLGFTACESDRLAKLPPACEPLRGFVETVDDIEDRAEDEEDYFAGLEMVSLRSPDGRPLPKVMEGYLLNLVEKSHGRRFADQRAAKIYMDKLPEAQRIPVIFLFLSGLHEELLRHDFPEREADYAVLSAYKSIGSVECGVETEF